MTNLPTYSRNSPTISSTVTRIATSKIKFIYRHLAVNKKIVLRAFCKQAADTRAGSGQCTLILGRDDITSSGPNSTVVASNTNETYDDTNTTDLAFNHGTSYSVITVTDDVSSGLTAGNLYEMSVAMRGGIDSSQNSVTMTMFGVIVVVTGDSS